MNQRVAQIDRTRQAILEAATDLYLSESDPTALTMQAIADAAGVSHRTLYRHFSSRQELINAIGQAVDQRLVDSGLWNEVTSFETWIGGVDEVVAFGAAHRDQLRRGLAIAIATGDHRTDRDEMYWDFFRARFPHLDDETARQSFVCVRSLLSAINVILMGERFDVAPDELAPTIGFGVQALLDRIAALDEAAQEASS
jgi:AcrR family transcriptional regulator